MSDLRANDEPLSFAMPYASERAPAFGTSAVASSHAHASQVALRVLQDGGNAIDAAVAAAAALTVVEPTMNGIGGDLFALVWDGAQLHGLNASGRAPRAWSLERFAGRASMPELGWDAVTVPGAVSGWALLQARFGTRSLSELLAPAARYARDGFIVTPKVAALWAEAPARFGEFAEFRRVFSTNGKPPSPGSKVALPDAAATLLEIGETHGESFYRGTLAKRIAAAARAQGGVLDERDLDAHVANWVEPLAVDYAGVRLHELPPNGQGLASLLALAILERHQLERFEPDDADAIHLQVEAMKLSFATCERYLADPDAMTVTAAALLDPRRVQSLADRIELGRAREPERFPAADHGTVYVATGDREGRMVSLIQSNYLGFGSGVVVPGTGIAMHNRGLGFRLDPRHPSCVAGGKRPYHTIMPGFVTRRGLPEMALGVIGGHMQPQGHVQLLIRSFLYRQNPQAAIDAPRWHVTERAELALEPALYARIGEDLRARGHRLLVEPRAILFGGAQAVRRLPHSYCAASDPRKDGQAVAV